MVDSQDDGYALKRHYRASARLDLQHYHWRDTVGHLIHPQITFDENSAQILEVACGTGIWLTDVARTLPSSAVLVGTDVSLDQCPPWLPSNVFLQTWSIFDEPPESLLGRFDVVHLRLLGFVLRDSQIAATIQRLMKVLKSGGWIQWGEYNHPSNTIVKADCRVSSTNFEILTKLLGQGLTPQNWVTNLEDTFREQELVSVQSFHHTPRRDHLWSIMNASLMAFEEVIVNSPKESTRDLEKLLAGAACEANSGVAWTGPRIEVIGRKP